MCDKVSRNLLFQQNVINLMLSRICTVKTVHTAVMYMYEHACMYLEPLSWLHCFKYKA